MSGRSLRRRIRRSDASRPGEESQGCWRIQADCNLQIDQLSFPLIALQNNGTSGGMVPVTGNGDYTLPGFADPAVTSLEIRMNNYDDLKAMVRNNYGGKLVDILDVTV
ncbi:MAG: hypothetical protein Q3M30_02175 [Candidatus Electrothrix sp. Rat3]|nr:hypothetical protein [Candidatus Electrothrix rattekaaiensis]